MGHSAAQERKHFCITGHGWEPALVALILSDDFPACDFHIAPPKPGPEAQLEPFVHAELSPAVERAISSAIIREWPDFVIAGGEMITIIPLMAGVFDPSQLMADARQRLGRQLPAIRQTIDLSQLRSGSAPTARDAQWGHTQATASVWLEHAEPLDLRRLVLADFNVDNMTGHRQYLPLIPGKILMRNIRRAPRTPKSDWSRDVDALAARYLNEFPSNLALAARLADAARQIVSRALLN